MDIKFNQNQHPKIKTEPYFQFNLNFFNKELTVNQGQVRKIRKISHYDQVNDSALLLFGYYRNLSNLSIESAKKGSTDYIDDQGSVFIIAPSDRVAFEMGKSRNTITSLKKQLKKAGLIREVRQGLNKPNLIYVQEVKAGYAEIQQFDQDGELIRKLDGNDQVFWEKEVTQSMSDLTEPKVAEEKENIEKTEQIHAQKGCTNFAHQKSQELVTNKKDSNKLYQSDTINDTSCENIYPSVKTQSLFLMSNHSFLTPKTINILALFGDSVAQKLQDKIFQAKRKIEMDVLIATKALAPKRKLAIPRLSGESWAFDLERTVCCFYAKVRLGMDSDTPVRDIFGYFYKTVLNFWRAAFVAEQSISVGSSDFDDFHNAIWSKQGSSTFDALGYDFEEIKYLNQKESFSNAVVKLVCPSNSTHRSISKEVMNLWR